MRSAFQLPSALVVARVPGLSSDAGLLGTRMPKRRSDMCLPTFWRASAACVALCLWVTRFNSKEAGAQESGFSSLKLCMCVRACLRVSGLVGRWVVGWFGSLFVGLVSWLVCYLRAFGLLPPAPFLGSSYIGGL